MRKTDSQPQTFVEMVLVLLEDRFPWLGTDRDASGSETVDELNDLHRTLLTAKGGGSTEPTQAIEQQPNLHCRHFAGLFFCHPNRRSAWILTTIIFDYVAHHIRQSVFSGAARRGAEMH